MCIYFTLARKMRRGFEWRINQKRAAWFIYFGQISPCLGQRSLDPMQIILEARANIRNFHYFFYLVVNHGNFLLGPTSTKHTKKTLMGAENSLVNVEIFFCHFLAHLQLFICYSLLGFLFWIWFAKELRLNF